MTLTNNMPTVIDLFCGCGGMSWGLHQAGFRVLAGVDNWTQALATFVLNHPGALAVEADLTCYKPSLLRHELGIEKGDLDCIVGGPPCQGFSKNVPAAYRFLNDPRNQLYREFIDFVEEFEPRAVLMENVAEIYNAYGGHVRDEFVQRLEQFGYKTSVRVLHAPDYGIPQRRRRCFFLAARTGGKPVFPAPSFAQTEEITLLEHRPGYRSAWSAISDLPKLENGEGFEPMDYDSEPLNEYQAFMRRNSDKLYDHITRKLSDKQMARVSSLEAGQAHKDLPPDLRPKSGYSGAYGRLDYEMVAPTITRWVFHPGSGRFCHPREERIITIREAARLQSFSDDFRFTGSYINKAHQVGNAVPPMLTTTLADSIKACCQEPAR